MSSPIPDRRIAEYRNVDPATFREEILPQARPVVLRGLVAHWPAVQAGLKSPSALAGHIRSFDNGAPVRFSEGAPEIQGRFFYNDDLTGVNFTQHEATIGVVLDRLLALRDDPDPPAVAMQSILAPEATPGFARANPSPVLEDAIVPRLWIGNAATVQTHHDMNDNLACVVAGRRRFILFPPDQTRNLYIGPFERTPAGPPISMVSITEPDLELYPRFPEAWAAAEAAELEPGDALFIPYMWWHHVQSLDRFSMLVNYWWNEAEPRTPPLGALVHAMMSVRDLPASQREVWRAMFDAFVFQADDPPGAHLPEGKRGVQGRLSPAAFAQMRKIIGRNLAG